MNDVDKIEIKTLLDKIGVLRYQYSLLNKDERFNIFEILRKRDEEVQLHSRFIAELLNPNGTHNQKNVFLNLFLKNLKEEIGDFSYDGAYVAIEEYVGEIKKEDNETRGGRIDILITKENCDPIVIENKIYASDQKHQLLRYYNFLIDKHKGKGIIIYLTLDGKAPSDDSLGNGQLDNSKITLFSYENHIRNWITECIEKASQKPGLRECLIQYQNLIDDLTGNSTTMEERLKLISLLGENENILNARRVVENWIHVRWHVEMDYWNALEKTIKDDGFNILENQKFSEELLSGVIHRVQNRNPWYGIAIELGKIKDHKIFLMIERSFGDMYFGIRMENEFDNKSEFSRLKDIFTKYFNKEFGFDDIWAGKEYLNPKVNFESFSNDDTLLLCNPEKRMKTISTHWEQIKTKIDECKKAFQMQLD
jgi:hypothetical protein